MDRETKTDCFVFNTDKTADHETHYFTVDLIDATVGKTSDGGDEGPESALYGASDGASADTATSDPPVETVAISYEEVEWTY